MPTQSLTLKIRGDIYDPADTTWAANWERWQVLGVPPVPRIYDPAGDAKAFPWDDGYLAEYPDLTASPVSDTGFPSNWVNPLADGDATIEIDGPPTYLGTGSGTHEWGVDVEITTPDFFFVGVKKVSFGNEENIPVYLPAPLYIVALEWEPLTWTGGGSYIGNIQTFLGGVVDPVFGETTINPFLTGFNPPAPSGFFLTVSQEVDGDALSMTVGNTTGAVAFYGWQFLDDNEEYVDHPGVPPFDAVNLVDYIVAEPWGPYEETGQSIEYDGEGAWVRAVAFDENGYWGLNEASERGRFRPFIGGRQIEAVSDSDAVTYAAARNGDDVQVEEFKNGAPTRIVKAVIANSSNPGIYRHQNDSTLYVTVRDRATSVYKIYESNDLGATVSLMANSPFDSATYKVPASAALNDGGHAQAAHKKGTDEVWFAYSWDGTNWSTPVEAFDLAGIKGISIYQESASSSDVIVITAMTADGTVLKATDDLGATTPWPDYEAL